jgi:hypothetical protein
MSTSVISVYVPAVNIIDKLRGGNICKIENAITSRHEILVYLCICFTNCEHKPVIYVLRICKIYLGICLAQIYVALYIRIVKLVSVRVFLELNSITR